MGDVGPLRIRDIWLNFPLKGATAPVYDNPAEREDFLIPRLPD